MYRAAKSLELVEVEVYGCFILCPYLFFAQNFDFVQCYLSIVSSSIILLNSYIPHSLQNHIILS